MGTGADRVIELALEEDELVRFKQSANVIKDYQQRADRIIEKLLS